MQELNIIQWLVLAIIQGITEYLPVSSSAHLILVSKILNWQDQGLVMDIAAHGGSLFAVLIYFKDEIAKLFRGKNWQLFVQLAIASIPLAVFGFLLADFIEHNLRSPLVIAVSSVVFGVLLYLADKYQQKNANHKSKIGLKQAVLIGLGQVIALIPGASRSGVTITTALALGYNRTQSARFSFLLAIPALLMTTSYGFLQLYKQPTESNIIGASIIFGVSFIVSLISIKLFLQLIERIPM
ncbi:MAG TPA: undecaprenyl-diphosphate phosphatase, partial [Oceanospirillales bacterium]|nr:undecaprenyl-diphosphate phosphatase [Oceanospirillales bacterium]